MKYLDLSRKEKNLEKILDNFFWSLFFVNVRVPILQFGTDEKLICDKITETGPKG